MDEKLRKLSDDAKVTIEITRRQARMLYSIVAEMSSNIDKIMESMEADDVGRMAMTEVRACTVDGLSEALFFDGNLGAEEPGELAQIAFGHLVEEENDPEV